MEEILPCSPPPLLALSLLLERLIAITMESEHLEKQVRPEVKRGDTLAKLYTGDQQKSQNPDGKPTFYF